MKNNRKENVIEYVRKYPGTSSSEIMIGLELVISPATLRRELARLVTENKLIVEGQN